MKKFYALAHRDYGYCSWLVENVLYETESRATEAISAMNRGGMMATDVVIEDMQEGDALPEKMYVNIHWIWGNDDDEYRLPKTGTRERVSDHQVEYKVIHG